MLAKDCKIVSLTEPVVAGSKSMVKPEPVCGTAINGLLSSFSGVSSLITNGVSISNKSGL